MSKWDDRSFMILGGCVVAATVLTLSLSWTTAQKAGSDMARAWVMDKARAFNQLADSELKNLRLEIQQEFAVVQSMPPVVDMNDAVKFKSGPWLYDLALWQKSPTTGEPERVALAVNTARIESVSAWKAKLKGADLSDVLYVKDSATFRTPRTGINWMMGVSSGLLTYTFPLRERDPDSPILVAHVSSARLQRIFETAKEDTGEASVVLVDGRGMVIGARDSKLTDGSHSHLEVMPGAEWVRNPFRWGGWSIMVSQPGADVMVLAESRMKWRGVLFVLAEAVIFALATLTWPSRFKIKNISQVRLIKKYPFFVFPKSKFNSVSASSESRPSVQPAQILQVDVVKSLSIVLCGQLLGLDEILEKSGNMGPDEVMDSLREFQAVLRHRVSQSEGKLDLVENGGFFVTWESDAAKKALRCTLDLRRDFAVWMESRRVDGKRMLSYSMAMHQAHCLSGTLIGEVYQDVRALCSASLSMKVDLLVSQPVWDTCLGSAVGVSVGDVKLTERTGLVCGYFVKGYVDSSGQEVIVDTPYSGQPKSISSVMSKKWLVNNGSTIEGPLTASEIACRLYAQEIDFDSECFEDGSGNSSTISQAGIFSGTEDKGADLWVFDGQTIHGPVTDKFASMAAGRGAMDVNQSYFCRSSTLNGWTPLSQLIQNNVVNMAKAEPQALPDPGQKAA